MAFFPDFADSRIWSVYVAAFSLLSLTLIFGGKPERWGVGVLALMLVAQNSVVALFTEKDIFLSIDPASLTADLIGLVGFTVIILNARRLWPILAFALQLLTVLGHLLQTTSEMVAYTYVTFKSYPTMTIVVVAALASIAHQFRLRRNGEDPDWVAYRAYAQFRKELRALQKL